MYDAFVCGMPRGLLVLAQPNIIRDVGRALPALVSGPDLGVPVSGESLDAHAAALYEQYDSLLPVFERAGDALSERPTARPALRSAARRSAFGPAPPSIMEHPPTVTAFPLADVP